MNDWNTDDQGIERNKAGRTKAAQGHVDQLWGVLDKYKVDNPDAEFITITALKKLSGMGKGRLRKTIGDAKIGITPSKVTNFYQQWKAGEVTQYQISL